MTAATNPTATPCPAAQAPCTAPTLEQLGLAYRHLWRQGWPATLEAALEKPGYRVAITQVARRMHRRHMAASSAHSLPKLAAPPTPGTRELTGALKHGRSPYSIATGPQTELTSWRGSSPKSMMAGAPHIPRQYFDHKKAAAHDLDD